MELGVLRESTEEEEANTMVEPHTPSAAMNSSVSGDLISNLPDEILSRIISMLPLESGVQVSFLSKRWRGLWNMALLQGGDIQHTATALPSFVANFDELDPSRNTRKLRYSFGKGRVLLATIAPKNKLLVDFSTGKQDPPTHFGLKLEMNPSHQPCSSAFCVKILHLISVNHLANEAVASVVSSFRFLESLKITKCIGLESLHIASSSKLENLTILDCPQLKSLHITSPKLKSFVFRGLLPWFCPEYHFNLEYAMLDFRQGPCCDSFKSSDFDPLLLTIKNAKILTLCRWTFEALIQPSLSCLHAHFRFYRLKELWWVDDSNHRHDSDALISFLKICPALERLFITIDPRSYMVPSRVEKLKQVSSQRQPESMVWNNLVLRTNDPLIITTSDSNGHFQQRFEQWPKHPHMHL